MHINLQNPKHDAKDEYLPPWCTLSDFYRRVERLKTFWCLRNSTHFRFWNSALKANLQFDQSPILAKRALPVYSWCKHWGTVLLPSSSCISFSRTIFSLTSFQMFPFGVQHNLMSDSMLLTPTLQVSEDSATSLSFLQTYTCGVVINYPFFLDLIYVYFSKLHFEFWLVLWDPASRIWLASATFLRIDCTSWFCFCRFILHPDSSPLEPVVKHGRKKWQNNIYVDYLNYFQDPWIVELVDFLYVPLWTQLYLCTSSPSLTRPLQNMPLLFIMH